MPYKILWLVEKRVVYTSMYGYVTGEDIEAHNEEMQSYIQESEQLLHMINDSTYTTSTNMGLRDLQKTQFPIIPNLGWAIYVSPSKIHRFFATVVTQLMGKRGREFATMEQALHFLQDIDDTLPPLQIPDKSYITT